MITFSQSSVPIERLRFNRHLQREDESFNSYLTALRRLASTCDFIDLDNMFCDWILFGIQDAEVNEHLLCVQDFILQKTVELCLASEQSLANIKIIGKATPSMAVHTLSGAKKKKEYKLKSSYQGETVTKNSLGFKTTSQGDATQKTEKYYKFCGTLHVFGKQNCRAVGKTCKVCGKRDHFRVFQDAKDSKDSRKQAKVHKISYGQEDSIGQIFNIGNISAKKAMITLRFKNGEKEQFQIDTGVDHTMLPLRVYKRITGDYKPKNVVHGNDFVRNYGDKKTANFGYSNHSCVEARWLHCLTGVSYHSR